MHTPHTLELRGAPARVPVGALLSEPDSSGLPLTGQDNHRPRVQGRREGKSAPGHAAHLAPGAAPPVAGVRPGALDRAAVPRARPRDLLAHRRALRGRGRALVRCRGIDRARLDRAPAVPSARGAAAAWARATRGRSRAGDLPDAAPCRESGGWPRRGLRDRGWRTRATRCARLRRWRRSPASSWPCSPGSCP